MGDVSLLQWVVQLLVPPTLMAAFTAIWVSLYHSPPLAAITAFIVAALTFLSLLASVGFLKGEEGTPHQTPEGHARLVSVYTAVDYIAKGSLWGLKTLKATEASQRYLMPMAAIGVFTTMASAGVVRVHGQYDDDGVHAPIPKEVWLSSTLDYDALYTLKMGRTVPLDSQHTVPYYTNLYVNVADLFKVWPKPSRYQAWQLKRNR